jgi:hypothetical protein
MAKLLVLVGLAFAPACITDGADSFRTASEVTSAIEKLPGIVCTSNHNGSCALACERLQISIYRTGSGLFAAACH